MKNGRTGRPLSFDRDAVLHKAMLLFWQHGYEATSVSELTSAMNITVPSVYTAFGDKKGLFLEAVDRYISGPVTSATIIDNAATSYEAAMNLLRASAHGFTGTQTPPGCLLASSAISCSPAAADVQARLASIRYEIEAHLKNKIIADTRSGKLPDETDADALAGHVMAVIQGMSTLARDGANREKLMKIVSLAMLVWPSIS